MDAVWIPVCGHAKGGVWMAIISYGFLTLKLMKNLDLAVLVQLTMSSKQGKKLLKSALTFILMASAPHK